MELAEPLSEAEDTRPLNPSLNQPLFGQIRLEIPSRGSALLARK
jgi:hypothetical protein